MNAAIHARQRTETQCDRPTACALTKRSVDRSTKTFYEVTVADWRGEPGQFRLLVLEKDGSVGITLSRLGTDDDNRTGELTVDQAKAMQRALGEAIAEAQP